MVEQLEGRSRVVLNKHRRTAHQVMPQPEGTGVMFRGMRTVSEDCPGVDKEWVFDSEIQNYVPSKKSKIVIASD